jgi:dihydrodipicolinate synthase/N-acetylneuraminate lyase
VLQGCLAASVTPLRDGGDPLDDAAFPALTAYLAAGGVDGILALGTTGEGILLSAAERRRAAELFVVNANGLDIAVHCGAQTTRETAGLCEHAASIGAAAVAVIGPPYFALDEASLLAHFAAAARACAPLPFYVYEFAARAGYSIPLTVLRRLRDAAPNLAGLKVSTTPWEKFEPYLHEGLDVFAGPEAFIHRALEAGAKGAVSGLAAAYPEAVAAHVKHPTAADSERIGKLRSSLQALPFNAAMKRVLGMRGVPISPDVRRPLRSLTADEAKLLDRIDHEWQASSSRAPAP